MVLPIRAYGDPILRTEARPIDADSPDLQRLIDDLLETMRVAEGAGLAAPQVGQPLRLFVADLRGARRALAAHPPLPPQPMVCINPVIIAASDDEMEFEEGCLSIPNVPERLWRPARITLQYLDRTFQLQQIEGVGPVASVLQHERDHLDGILHIDYLPPLRKRLLQGRLRRIRQGHVQAAYPMQIEGRPLLRAR